MEELRQKRVKLFGIVQHDEMSCITYSMGVQPGQLGQKVVLTVILAVNVDRITQRPEQIEELAAV